MARTGTTTSVDDGCAPIAADLTGHVVLIRRGTCPFHIKALNAQNAGAAAVVLYNNVAGRFSPPWRATRPSPSPSWRSPTPRARSSTAASPSATSR
jgi:hypothetical protein